MNKSALTSINQIPAIHKKIDWQWGQCNLDVGGGKYDTATNYLASLGVNNFVYDPYNRSEEHNAKCLLFKGYNSATIANVLNVITTSDERKRALTTAKESVRPGGKIYISVYEGNRSGAGSVSSKGTYQANKKLKEYLCEIYEVWPQELVKIKRNMIEVVNGKDESPKVMCPSCMQLPNR